MADLVSLLRRGGVSNVDDHRVPGHPGRLVIEGIVVHHTAMKGPGLKTVIAGRPDLKGPLANINIPRGGRVNVVTDGVAWHAGPGSAHVLAGVRHNARPAGDAHALGLPDDFNGGNKVYLGIEVDNDGIGEPYPDVQVAALVYVCAAVIHLAIKGGNENRVVHHREHTARKVDMSYHGPLRDLVGQRLHALQLGH